MDERQVRAAPGDLEQWTVPVRSAGRRGRATRSSLARSSPHVELRGQPLRRDRGVYEKMDDIDKTDRFDRRELLGRVFRAVQPPSTSAARIAGPTGRTRTTRPRPGRASSTDAELSVGVRQHLRREGGYVSGLVVANGDPLQAERPAAERDDRGPGRGPTASPPPMLRRPEPANLVARARVRIRVFGEVDRDDPQRILEWKVNYEPVPVRDRTPQASRAAASDDTPAHIRSRRPCSTWRRRPTTRSASSRTCWSAASAECGRLLHG